MKSQVFKSVITATDLPEAPIANELSKLIEQHGFNHEDLSIDQLREVMADYLNSVFLELLEEDDDSVSA